MMKIFPGMSLESVKRMDWLESNILISCHNRDMRDQKRRRDKEQRKMRSRSRTRRPRR